MARARITSDPDSFYAHLFTEDPFWSTPFPNNDEAVRLAKIFEYLSLITQSNGQSDHHRLRILDAGCGRGWLTHAVSIFGDSEGFDPVAAVIDSARKAFPHERFYVGSLRDFLASADFRPYDVVIASEVIEHVSDKQAFVRELRAALVANGYVVLTTPRGEEYKKWLHLGYEEQPIESWISEKGTRKLFSDCGFAAVEHGRAYLDLAPMSMLHLACSSPKLKHIMESLGLDWIRAGLLYKAGFYQTWLFKKVDE